MQAEVLNNQFILGKIIYDQNIFQVSVIKPTPEQKCEQTNGKNKETKQEKPIKKFLSILSQFFFKKF